MLTLKFSRNRILHCSPYLQVLAAISVICFLVASFYTASLLSEIPFGSFLSHSNNDVDYVHSDLIEVMITTDKSGIAGVLALANSILVNTNRPVHFYFVTSSDAVYDLHAALESANLSRMSYIIKAFDANKFSINATSSLDFNDEENLLDFSKFYIPDLFPQTSGILISLSNDVIVQGDIAELRNANLSNYHLGALTSNCDTLSKIIYKQRNRYFHYLNMNNSHIKNAHLKGNQCTFDLSVMVLNMTLWNKENVTQQLEHWWHLNKKEHIFLKQSALSPFLIVFNNRTSSLDNSWHVRHLGVTKGSRHSQKYLQSANLLQWNGHFKPWRHKSAIYDIWARYALKITSQRLPHKAKD